MPESRKDFPLSVPTSIWASFISDKDARFPHMSINATIIEAMIAHVKEGEGEKK